MGSWNDTRRNCSAGRPGSIGGPGSISVNLSDPGCIRGPGSIKVNTVVGCDSHFVLCILTFFEKLTV